MKNLFFAFIILICGYAKAQSLKSFKTFENDTVYIDFINPFYAPIEINLKPLDSTKEFIKVNPYGVLKHGDTLKNALAIPIQHVKDTANMSSKEFIDFSGFFGDPDAKVNDDYLYTLPFQRGKRYKIIQSFGGRFSHNLKSSKYAIDFGTQIGDTIVAARGGQVFYVKEDSKEHCRTRKCMNKANKILIIHDDGTYANYVHLDFEGALVEVGDTVKAGQAIGISGMTGFTTIPHLHFVVHTARGISVPVYFKDFGKKKLKQGKKYTRRR